MTFAQSERVALSQASMAILMRELNVATVTSITVVPTEHYLGRVEYSMMPDLCTVGTLKTVWWPISAMSVVAIWLGQTLSVTLVPGTLPMNWPRASPTWKTLIGAIPRAICRPISCRAACSEQAHSLQTTSRVFAVLLRGSCKRANSKAPTWWHSFSRPLHALH
jgi:hypothetical protein